MVYRNNSNYKNHHVSSGRMNICIDSNKMLKMMII